MTTFFYCAEYIFSFVEIYMSFLFCGAFLRKSESTLSNCYKILISLCAAFITVSLGRIQLFSAFNTVLLFLVVWLLQKLTYQTGFARTFGIVISYYAVVFIIDVLNSSIVALVQNISISEIFNHLSLERLGAALGSKSILVILCIMLNRRIRHSNTFNNTSNILYSVSSIIMILISSIMYFTQSKSNSENINFVMALFFTIMLVLIFLIYITIINFFDRQQEKQELELIDQKNISLEHTIDELETTFSMWRQSVHDYKNTILVVDSMLKQNKLEELSDYIQKEIQEFSDYAVYIRTGNSAVDTIINAKYALAKQKGIYMTMNLSIPPECAISDIHLASVLGNLLDNAIEAELEETEPYIHVQIAMVKSFFIFKIVNKCSRESLKLSTNKKKKEFHGIGLKSIRKVADLYNGAFSLELINGEAVAMVMMQNTPVS